MKKLMYIILFLMMAATLAAQETYVIDSLCMDNERNYRIHGWLGSTYEWIITDEVFDTVFHDAGTDFQVDTIHGSEIDVFWDTPGIYLITNIQTSSHGCDTIEAGIVKVFNPPFADAGPDQFICTSHLVSLRDAQAEYYSRVEWTTRGDGVFDDNTLVNPKYSRGDADSIRRSVTLIITAYGLAENGTCDPVVDSLIIEFSNPEVNLTVDHLKCFNDSTGQIIADVWGNAPFTFEWTGPNGYTAKGTDDSSHRIYGLIAGIYHLKVTDSMRCEVYHTVEVTQPNELFAYIDNFENVTCFGGNNGMAVATGLGGTPGYHYIWDTDPFQYSQTARNLIAGTYNVTVSDDNACNAYASVIITEPEPLALTADSVDAKCLGSSPGSVDLEVTGGTPFTVGDPYLYEWKDESGLIISTTEDLENLPGDMLYTVVVTDSLGCMDTLSIRVNTEQDIKLAFNSIDSILCYGETGSIYMAIRDGLEPYDILWNTGDTNDSLINVPAGQYEIKVTDANSCTVDTIINLTQPELLLAEITASEQAVCQDVSINLNGNPEGGTGSYTHLWTGSGAIYLDADNIVDPVFSNAPGGIYELIYSVTDENSCEALDTISLEIWPITYETIDSAICPEDVPFAFNDSVYYTTGSYEYLTTNIYGCDSIITLNLTVYDEMLLTTTAIDAGPNNEPVGSIDLVVTGGTSPYTFLWSNGETTEDLTGLVSGIYDVEVIDAHGCKTSTSVTVITEPGNTFLSCPPRITVEDCPDAIESVYNSFAEFVADGGSVTSDCGVDTTKFTWAGDQEVNGIFCVNIRRTYLIQDSCGSWVECVQDIVVDDRISPVMNCPPERTVPTASVPPAFVNYSAYLNAGGIASDNCDIVEGSFRLAKVNNSDPQKIIRTYEITDICGNKATCDHVINITEDSEFYIVCPPDILVQCPEDVPPAYADYAEFIAAGGTVVTNGIVVLDENSFTWVGDVSDGNTCPEIITRTYSLSDTDGNTVTCTQTITINDTEAPVLVLAAIRDKECEDDIPATYKNYAQFDAVSGNYASDNCALDYSSFRFVRESRVGTCPLTIVRWYEIKDLCDNTTVATQNIIIDDKTKPRIIRTPRPLTAICEIPLPYRNRTEYETSGGFFFENCNNGFYELKFIGDNILNDGCPTEIIRTYRAIDICGNYTDVQQTIIVNDTIPPEITCPPDDSFDAGVNDLLALTGLAYSETVQQIPVSNIATFGVSVYDSCGVVKITYQDTVVGGCPAVVTRTFTAYDQCGNSSSCEQEITLTQGILITLDNVVNVGPSVLPIGSIEITVSGGDEPYLYSWTGPDGYTSTDEDIYNLYPGDYTVTVIDANNCISTITVSITDEEIVTSLECPPTIEVECTNSLMEYPPYIYYAEFVAAGGEAESNCGIDTTSFALISQDTLDGVFCLTLLRTYTISDFCGNDTTCSQLVIVNDPIPPVIVCPPDSAAECISDLNMNISTIADFIAAGGSISDNCDIDSASFTINKVITIIPGGSEIRTTYSIKDLCGNIDSCEHNMMSTDDIAPEGTCTDITVYLDEIGQYMFTGKDKGRLTAGFTDNCTQPEDLLFEIDITEFDCEDVEEGVVVTITITDEAGNSTVCESIVTVLDTLPPQAVCQDLTLYLDENGMAGIITGMINDGSTDNCGLDTMYLSKYIFDCNDVGENIVVLTVVDEYGMMDSCGAVVTVIDSIPPVVTCVAPFSIQLDENAHYELLVEEIHVDSYDECGIDTLFLDIYDLDCDNIGVQPVMLTAYDVNGNWSTCETEITVYGNIPPNALPDSAITIMNVPIDVDVISNDYDIKTSINRASLAVRMNPLHGTIETNVVNGFLTYIPEKDFVGYDTLIYSICDDAIPCEPMCDSTFVYLKVVYPNNPPIAVDDYYVASCGPLTGNVLDNDYDMEGDNIFAVTKPIKLPIHGVVFIEDDGSFTYLPDAGFAGIDSFMYAIYDDGLPSMGDTAMVYITKFPDHDCDGIPDVDDIDDDDDGILDVVEDPTLGANPPDSDQDGIPDYLDIDSDNDGIVDNIEGQGEGIDDYIFPIGRDENGNGWDDAYDPEMGGFEFTPIDTDQDGMPDYVDIDAENDHVFDFIEGHDINADGIPDVTRVFVDSDNDGLDDIYDIVNGWTGSMDTRNALGSNAPLQDFDGDGIRDWRDTNDENDEFLTKDEDTNNDGDYSNDDLDLDGYPEYLDKTLDCELFIPEGFSPNDDGIHDFFQILCIQKYPNAHLMIFNRNGDKLFEKEHYGNLDVWGTNENAWWWGTSENKLTLGRSGGLPAGNYVYVLDLGNGEVKNGTVMIAY